MRNKRVRALCRSLEAPPVPLLQSLQSLLHVLLSRCIAHARGKLDIFRKLIGRKDELAEPTTTPFDGSNMAPRKTSPEKPKRGRPRTSTPSAQPAARADPNLDAPEPTSSSKSVARGFTASNASSHRAPDSSKKNNVIQIYTDADLSASDEVSSSGGDIPPRKEKQKADAKRKKEEAVVAADDAEDDDEEEEEYVVEKVVGHKFDRVRTVEDGAPSALHARLLLIRSCRRSFSSKSSGWATRPQTTQWSPR